MAAPPSDVSGNVNTQFRGVGAHRSHIGTSNWHKEVQCSECHQVPATTATVGTGGSRAENPYSTMLAVLGGMAAEGHPYRGFLYVGLMLTADGPKVIEFNVRFGDPETQPVLLRLQSDLLDLVEAALGGQLHRTRAEWNPRPSLGVVMAARPYPETPITGDVIEGLDAVPIEAKVFHAGTALVDRSSAPRSSWRDAVPAPGRERGH